jgi:hypothetical protein
MQGRKGTPWAQPGLHTPPPPNQEKKRKRESLNRDSASLRAQPAPWVANMPFLRLMDLDNFNLHDFYKADRARLILFIFFKKNFYRATPPT